MKIINYPKECGYRIPEHGFSVCNHLKRDGGNCLHPNSFPKGCPLQEGMPTPKTSLPGEYRNDLPGGKLVKKRRNRKECIYYERGCDRGKIDIIPCAGVTCGYFKTKQDE